METSILCGTAETQWNLLPASLRQLIVPLDKRDRIEEVRLRLGQPFSLVSEGREWSLPQWKKPISEDDIAWILETAGNGSMHTIMEQLKQGFVSVEGGHRIGICGSAVMKQGEMVNFRKISSLSIRFAHAVTGIAEPLLRALQKNGSLQSTLIFSPPGGGKTTLLRDLIRCVSDGVGVSAMRVGVADERGELCGMYHGVPQQNIGTHTDVMDGCPKAQALLMLLRGMNPQVLAVDEITDPRDVQAVEETAGCGVSLLATAHGGSPEELRLRPIYRALLQKGIFRCFISIRQEAGKRHYHILSAKEMGDG